MKTLIFFSILFCVIAETVVAELTQDDLNKIRLIVKEEVKAEIVSIKEDIKTLDTRLQKVEQNDARLDGRLDGIDKQIAHGNNLTYALIALIIFAIGLPAWQNRKDREENRKIETLTQRLEALEQQRTID